MNNPLVSVIIPNYNHAKFLDERIQSVLNQTYQNFELIILDDKSTDNSVEVINQYKDNPHVSHIVVNEENSGSTFKQWHKGFELAKGEVIWIAESDDSCDTTMLETLVRGYVEHDAVLAFCRSCKYDIEGKKSIYTPQNFLSGDMAMPGWEFISNYLVPKNAVANASSAVFSRSIAMSLDKQYISMRAEGDWLFWIELMEHGNVCFYDKAMNYFRFHHMNTTSILSQEGIGDIEHKKIVDYLLKGNHISYKRYKEEIIHYVSYILHYRDFEAKSVKRKVLQVWDRYKYYRTYIYLGSLKDEILLYLKNTGSTKNSLYGE